MLLTSVVHGSRIQGSLVSPQHFTEEADGHLSGVMLPIITRKVVGKQMKGVVHLYVGNAPDIDQMKMVVSSPDHASLSLFKDMVPELKLTRASGQVTVSNDWPSVTTDPSIITVREELRAAAQKDTVARQKIKIDQDEIDQLQAESRSLVEDTFNQYGWPTITVFGFQASQDYWLLVQHQSADTQKRLLSGLETVMRKGEATKQSYAYLFDRVQISQGRQQHWGTQSRCDQGHAVLYPVDDLRGLKQRRLEAGLDPTSQQATDEICQRVESKNPRNAPE